MRPEARINLRNDDLPVGGAPVIDLFAKKSRGVQAVGADFDLPAGIARDELMGVDGLFELRRITGDAVKAQGHGNNIIGKGGHFLGIIEAELAGSVEGGVKHPDAELRELIELDFVALEQADIVETWKFADEAFD